MKCEKCGFINEEGKDFCEQCNEALVVEEKENLIDKAEEKIIEAEYVAEDLKEAIVEKSEETFIKDQYIAEDIVEKVEEEVKGEKKVLSPEDKKKRNLKFSFFGLLLAFIVVVALLYKPIGFSITYNIGKWTNSTTFLELATRIDKRSDAVALLVNNIEGDLKNLESGDFDGRIKIYERLSKVDTNRTKIYKNYITGYYALKAISFIPDDLEKARETAKKGFEETENALLTSVENTCDVVEEYIEQFGTFKIGQLGEEDLEDINISEYIMMFVNSRDAADTSNYKSEDEALSTVKEAAEKSIKESKILLHLFNTGNYTVDMDVIMQQIDTLNQNYENSFPGDTGREDFKARLINDFDEYKTMYFKILISSMMIESHALNIEVSDEDINKLYEESPYMYDRFRLQILELSKVDEEGNSLSNAETKKKRELAEKLLKELNNGADFDKILDENTENQVHGNPEAGADYSRSIYTIQYGDDNSYGIFGDKEQDFFEWADTSKEDEYFMFEGDDFILILKVLNRETINDDTFEGKSLRTRFIPYVQQTKMNDLMADWLEDPKYDLILDDDLVKRVIDEKGLIKSEVAE